MARRKYFKHGNPEYGTWWNDSQWEGMTADQKKNWVPSDEIEEHPVPKEVTDFMKQPQANPNDDLARIEPMAKDMQKLTDYIVKEFPDHKFTGNVVDDTISIIKKHIPETPEIPEAPTEELGKITTTGEEEKTDSPFNFDPTDRDFLKTELTKLGVEYDKRLSTKRLTKLYEETIAKNK